MGLLDDLVGSLTGGQQNNLGQLQAVWNWVQEQGGVEVLIQKFQQGGLGEILSTWLSNGANQSVSSDDIKSALSSQDLESLAGKLGTDVDGASGVLSKILPELMDKISPQGEVHPEATGTNSSPDLGSLVASIFKS
ncbi:MULTISPECIES: YidB family protein [Tatumella]|uniref:YidB family protein n=2 Tax=Tatumella ptyseos TaxID=82987 RepID=A0A085J9I3_9GAMM|nr:MULTISPECIES: YidB family protein [Tatumella]KFD17129.1 hypothetical protein GTPT_3258 [Tatumella ptyseos ATCC 33301]SQK72520.1 Uncharacterized protein conserved in bacteria [Tatumella ptyseos]